MYDALRESLPNITERQRQVIELIAAGCSNDEVGERLGISPRTAKAHSDVLRQKLGVTRRRQIPVAYRAITGDDPLARLAGHRRDAVEVGVVVKHRKAAAFGRGGDEEIAPRPPRQRSLGRSVCAGARSYSGEPTKPTTAWLSQKPP